MRGYSTVGSVAQYLNTTLSAAGSAEGTAALSAAEEAIDAYTGRAWLTGAITNERVMVEGPYIYLRALPVSSVSAVTGRYYGSTATTTLAVDVDYEEYDLTRGLLIFSSYHPHLDSQGFPAYGRPYDYLQVSYTPGTALPASITRAATIIAARGMRSYVTGGAGDAVERTAGDVTLRFDPSAIQAPWPAEVTKLLAPYRRSLVA